MSEIEKKQARKNAQKWIQRVAKRDQSASTANNDGDLPNSQNSAFFWDSHVTHTEAAKEYKEQDNYINYSKLQMQKIQAELAQNGDE